MLIYGVQPAAHEPRAFRILEQRRGRTAEELPGEGPVDQPDGRLERARPVGALSVRAGSDPALYVLPDDVKMARIAAECIGLGQRHEMRMPAELPKVSDVAHQP